MEELKRNICKIFVDSQQQKVPMLATVNVRTKAIFEKVQSIGEEKILGFVESGKFFEISLLVLGTGSAFDALSNFNLTIEYGEKTEKYNNCVVTDKQEVLDGNELFWKQKIVIASSERE